MNKEIDKVIAIMGTQAKLARALGVSHNAVWKWVRQGYVPPARVIAVAQLVEGLCTPHGQQVNIETLLRESSEYAHGTLNTRSDSRE